MEGTYNCEAKNKENTTSSSATLRVYGKFNDNDDNDNDDDNDDDDDDDDDNADRNDDADRNDNAKY